MTKNQKIWFAVFLAMFLVPEILWGSIVDFYYQLSQTSQSGGTYPLRYNFLTNSDNVGILKLVMLIELVGLACSFIVLLLARINNKVVKTLVFLIFATLLLIVGFAVLFAFNFNPQIG